MLPFVCHVCLGAFGVRAWLAKDSYRGRGRDEGGLHRPSGTTGFGRVGRRIDGDDEGFVSALVVHFSAFPKTTSMTKPSL